MAKESWTMAVTLCDSCKTSPASLFCRADSAFLCITCDGKVHAANKLASRHARVWMCEVCEQAPASVTCKADAAALCVTCDRDIHSANPLALRHERFPVVPFYDPATTVSKIGGGGDNNNNNNHHHYLSDFDVNVAGTEAEEAEAASWLLPNPNLNKIADGSDDDNNLKSESEYMFNEIDPYLDIDLKTPNQKPNQILHRYNSPTDGVVPVQNKNNNHHYQIPPHAHVSSDVVVEGLPAYDIDYTGSKPFMYNFTSQSISQSVSSSSLEIEVGVVPDHNAAMADVSNNHHHHQQSSGEVYPSPALGFDREARVLRYREKRKNRKFEKTIRYASRKAYAETRPRIKGRFAKRTEIDVEADDAFISPDYSSYGVVPSY
ncbi:hypothetical protein L6452_32275 [Arctium lappa]|uniref:Uncharacterized protein n=1 Tax=Arctium lappa TaxID=4217 RepID=A0ACB8Z3A0_ARCLA|nr:hypothetical protein L6452_32275 [Arctium lappa]